MLILNETMRSRNVLLHRKKEGTVSASENVKNCETLIAFLESDTLEDLSLLEPHVKKGCDCSNLTLAERNMGETLPSLLFLVFIVE